MNNCVYILLCINNRYYVGSTADLVMRLKKHIFGNVIATKYLRPLMLVFHQTFPTLMEARKMEKWIKKNKDRKLIERIIKDMEIKKLFPRAVR